MSSPPPCEPEVRQIFRASSTWSLGGGCTEPIIGPTDLQSLRSRCPSSLSCLPGDAIITWSATPSFTRTGSKTLAKQLDRWPWSNTSIFGGGSATWFSLLTPASSLGAGRRMTSTLRNFATSHSSTTAPPKHQLTTDLEALGTSHRQVFPLLADQNRCWTAERLALRGLSHAPCCILCDQTEETRHHLLAGYVVSRVTSHEVLSWCRLTISPPDGHADFFKWWSSDITGSPACVRKGLDSLIVLSAWSVWKHHNACIFDGAQPSHARLVQTIQEDVQSWARAGAKGLNMLDPVV